MTTSLPLTRSYLNGTWKSAFLNSSADNRTPVSQRAETQNYLTHGVRDVRFERWKTV